MHININELKNGKLTVLKKELLRTSYFYIWGQCHMSKTPFMSILVEIILYFQLVPLFSGQGYCNIGVSTAYSNTETKTVVHAQEKKLPGLAFIKLILVF